MAYRMMQFINCMVCVIDLRSGVVGGSIPRHCDHADVSLSKMLVDE